MAEPTPTISTATAPSTTDPPSASAPPLATTQTTNASTNTPSITTDEPWPPSTLPSLDSPLPPPILTTPRLHIRPLHPQDAPDLQRFCAPASITRYMSLAFAHPYTLQHARAWITLCLSSTPPLPNFAICAADAPATPIGGIGLKLGTDVHAHTAELGYWMAEGWQGRGLMREAVEGLCGWVFGGEGREGGDVGGGRRLTRLVGNVFGGNGGSMKVLERVGFVREGVMRGHVKKGDVVDDFVIYGVGREEWLEWKEGKEREREGQAGKEGK